jgi:hypothetical protein
MGKNDATEFLRTDFGECFQQMRYYHSQIFDVCKFAFLGYSSVLGVGIGLHEVGIQRKLDLVFPIIIIVLVGLVVGMVVFGFVIRNRSYFVVNTRYIKELRARFLAEKPLGFENNSAMYTDWRQPPYFDIWSSHLLASYMIAFFNASLAGFIFYVLKFSNCIIGTLSVVLVFLQIGYACRYLSNREDKSVKQTEGRQNKYDNDYGQE